MPKTTLVAVKCKLSKGLFPSERVFEVQLVDKTGYTGIAPAHFCWNGRGLLLKPGEAEADEIDGFVAARRIDGDFPDNVAAVEVPNGDAIAVEVDQVVSRPTAITPPKVKMYL